LSLISAHPTSVLENTSATFNAYVNRILTLPLIRGKIYGMENINVNEGVKPRPVCPICGATFMDRRGLNGHMAGKHGSKYGLNATVDSLVNEVRDLSTKIDNLINEIRESHVLVQRSLESQHEIVHEPPERLESVKREATEPPQEARSNQNVEGTQLPLE